MSTDYDADIIRWKNRHGEQLDAEIVRWGQRRAELADELNGATGSEALRISAALADVTKHLGRLDSMKRAIARY